MQFQFAQNVLTGRIKSFTLTAMDYADERVLTNMLRVFSIGQPVEFTVENATFVQSFTISISGPPQQEEGDADS
jgi:hypothetical protein